MRRADLEDWLGTPDYAQLADQAGRRYTLSMTSDVDHNANASDQSSETPKGQADMLAYSPSHDGARSYGAVAVGAQAAGTMAVGAFAIGALAVGAMAIGALAIGRLVVKRLSVQRSRIDRLEIDELTVRQLQVEEVIITKRYVVPDDNTHSV